MGLENDVIFEVDVRTRESVEYCSTVNEKSDMYSRSHRFIVAIRMFTVRMSEITERVNKVAENAIACVACRVANVACGGVCAGCRAVSAGRSRLKG